MTDSPLFPLPLSPFEIYMVVDDRPPYRMTFVMRLDFQGRVDVDALERALAMALARHPLLTARLVRKGGAWLWDRGEHVAPKIDVLAAGEGFDYASPPPLDLELGRNVRFRVRTEGEDVRLEGDFHHACTDGLGAIQFYGDWLAAYHALITAGEPAWTALDPERLRTRGDLRWPPPPHPITFWQALRGMLVEAVRWMSRRPVTLAVPAAAPPPSPSAFRGALVHTFTVEQTRELRDAARRQGVTLNDLLLRDLFVAIEAWNRERHAGERGWIQINMPTSLRLGKRDDEMPAANVIGYAFLARRPSECRDPNQLLQSLASDTKAIRAWGLGNFFLDGVRKAARFPFLMRWFARPGKCLATAVFSNLGDPQRRMNARLPREAGRMRAGDLTLQRLYGVPPVRQGTRAAFLASTSGSELTVCAGFDALLFTETASDELFDRWLQQTRRSLAHASALLPNPP